MHRNEIATPRWNRARNDDLGQAGTNLFHLETFFANWVLGESYSYNVESFGGCFGGWLIGWETAIYKAVPMAYILLDI